MSKKILSVVLAIVLVFTVTATAFAASVSYEDEDATYTQSWALGEPVDIGGGTWTVAVKLTANYPVMSFAFQLSNTDATNVTLKSAVVGKDIPNDDTAETFWNATVTVNKAAGRVAINPNPIDDAVPAIDCSTEKEIAVLTYTVVDGKSADIAIVNDPKTATNGDGTLVAARSANNNVVSDVDNPIVGQKVSSVGSAVTLGSAKVEPADLAVTAAYADKGIVIDTAKTFGGVYSGAVYGLASSSYKKGDYLAASFEATNGGSLIIKDAKGTAYVAGASGNWGTKATIEVYSADGTLSKTYVVVIFGDITCDGNINAADLTALKRNNTKAVLIAENCPERLAANLNAGTNANGYNINASDLTAMKRNNTKALLIDQVALASTHIRQAGQNNYN